MGIHDYHQRGYMIITRAEGIEHGRVSVALLGRQSASAKVGNEVREKSSVSEVPRTTGQRRRTEWECYLRSKPKK